MSDAAPTARGEGAKCPPALPTAFARAVSRSWTVMAP